MKEKIALLIAFVLLTGLIGGCKNTGTGKAEAPPSASVPSSSEGVQPSPFGSPEASPLAEGSPAPNAEKRSRLKVEVVRGSQPAPSVTKAADIAGHPLEKDINELLKTGAVELGADGAFHPNDPIKRGEFLVWLMKMDDKGVLPRDPENPSFSDVPRDHPLYRMVEGMKAVGVVAGYPDGTMRLEKELTREEISVLWGMYIRNKTVSAPFIDLKNVDRTMVSYYEDGGKVSDIFLKAVSSYITWGVIQEVFSKKGKLEPQKAVTRAQAAQWIVLCKAKEDKPDPSQVSEAAGSGDSSPAPTGGGDASGAEIVRIKDIAGSRDEREIVKLLESGAVNVNPSGEFRPLDPITRREFIRWLYFYNPDGVEPKKPGTPTFSDLKPDDPDYAIVEGLTASGRLKGYSDGTIRLDQGLTREELVLLWSIFRKEDYSGNGNFFSDGQIKLYGNSAGLDPEIRKPMGNAIFMGYYKRAFGLTPALGAKLPVLRTEAAKWIVVYYETREEIMK